MITLPGPGLTINASLSPSLPCKVSAAEEIAGALADGEKIRQSNFRARRFTALAQRHSTGERVGAKSNRTSFVILCADLIQNISRRPDTFLLDVENKLIWKSIGILWKMRSFLTFSYRKSEIVCLDFQVNVFFFGSINPMFSTVKYKLTNISPKLFPPRQRSLHR